MEGHGGECRVNKMEPGLDYDMYKDEAYSIVFIFENMSPDPTIVSTVYINIPKGSDENIYTDINGAKALGASFVLASTLAFLF